MKATATLIITLILIPWFAYSQTCSTNLAYGAYTTASSHLLNGNPGFATDNDLTTRWESYYLDPQSLTVDLGVPQSICSVVIRWENASGKNFLIQTSNDNSTWSTVATVANNATLTNTLTFSATARYVRMYGTARTSSYGYSIYEFQVFGTPAVTNPTSNLALSRPTVASSVANVAYPAASAFDGSLATRWESNYSDNQFIYVDLGSVRAIEKVELRWEAAYGRNFQIQFSNNGSAWTTAYNFVGNYSLVNNIYLTGSARYVRMQGINRATLYGYSLLEFSVFGGMIILPTTLTDFRVRRATQPVLEWKTATEQNAASFEIERKEPGQTNFQSVGNVKATGNSTTPVSYSWMDQHPLQTAVLYRLKLTDLDGKYTYSPVVSLGAATAQSAIQCRYYESSNTVVVSAGEAIRSVKIYNTNGVVQGFTQQGSGNLIQLSMNTSSPGIYIIHITTGTSETTQRFVKLK